MRQEDVLVVAFVMLAVGTPVSMAPAQVGKEPVVYKEADAPEALKPAVARATQAMQALQTTLLARLRRELDAGGPTAAVDVCRNEAQAMTLQVAREQGMAMGRTSHQLRNPLNAPRPWARAIVEAAAGKRAADVTGHVVDLGDRVGVLRPIGTAEMCTHCHGAPDVVQRAIGRVLADAYPADRAVGFAPGDLRGWIWVEVPKGP
jgi:signal transduction histidine kinase